MTAKSEVQESEREVWKLDTCATCRRRVWCGINETWCRHCNAYVEVKHVEVVPREVAERLAEALATIAADTDKPRFPEDPSRGRAWRVRLAHEVECEYRAAYPEKAAEA